MGARRGARGVGVEYDGKLADRARSTVASAGLEGSVEVLHGDACTLDLTPATKIFVYLVPSGLEVMLSSLTAALTRGVPVASYTFSLPGFEADRVLTADTRPPQCKVSLYQSL